MKELKEIKEYSFPEININIPKMNTTKNNTKMSFKISMLLTPDVSNHKIKTENPFYINKPNFFQSNNNNNIIKLNIHNKYNKTDTKFPIIKLKSLSQNKLYKTVNNKKEDKYNSEENSFNRLYQKFQMYNKKYKAVTRYFNFFATNRNNNTKMKIIKYPNEFKHISSITKHKKIKYCFNAFQRIKSIK